MDIDVVAIAGMIFTLLMVFLIGGVILMFPLARRLGALLEAKAAERREAGPVSAELDELRGAVRELESRVETLSERQRFVERLLEPGSPE